MARYFFKAHVEFPRWRHQMEIFSALPALSEGNHRSPVDSGTQELRNSEFYLTTLRTHRRGHRFINASRFSNGWYWNKAGEYSLTKLTKKCNLQRLNKEMMPYLVGVMLSGVPLRHIAAIIGPLQQYLNEKETDVAENFRLYVCHTLYGCE